MNILKKVVIFFIFVNAMASFSQHIIDVGDLPDENIKFDEALTIYKESRLEFIGLFSNNLLMTLLGERELLNNETLDIFSLSQLNNENLRLLRNMIFACYGYKFNSSDLNTYFSRFDWYKPTSNNVDSELTEIDKINIQRIQTFEKRNETLPDIKWDDNRIGVWQDFEREASGWGNRFVIHPTNQLEYYYSTMRELPIIFGMNGTYIIKGNVLIYSVTEIYYAINEIEIEFTGAFGYLFKRSENNTITLKNPMVFKFPISEITKKELRGKFPSEPDKFELETITIGGKGFYRLRDDANDKF
ncbi:MAG: YARHG domain-containing protein [Marinilabiliaceae bacterium]|nr:YARHG domain-containing protein [Marinilabiliaceae bacterium]